MPYSLPRMAKILMIDAMRKSIVYSGGSFHCLQAYFDGVKGALSTTAGYVNGQTSHPTFEQVEAGGTGHAEAVKVDFEDYFLDLTHLTEIFLRIIDPYSLGRQGPFVGKQYRAGIYYQNLSDGITLCRYVDTHLRPGHVVEVSRMDNFFPAEEAHQHYKRKHAFWNCPIDLNKLKADEKK